MPEHRERIVRKLQTPLTDDELIAAARSLALANQRLHSVQDDKSTTMADFNSRIKSAEGEIGSLSNIVANRSELRDIECDEIMDYDKNEFRTVRLDSGEVFFRRPLTEDERQMVLSAAETE